MTPVEGLAHLASRSPSSIKMGLERVRVALERLGHPELSVPAVHVAGTNGKGSTCAMIASCLSTAFRTGLYTSPHLVRVNERFRVGGVELDDEALGRAVAEIVERLGVDHELTYFELGTLVAFWCFGRAALDVAVLETGLGGRLDATTACLPKAVCLTSISFDHQEYLGTTIAEIAREKAGVIKPEVPVISSRQDPAALAVIAEVARAAAAPLLVEGRDFEASVDAQGRLAFRGGTLRLEGLELPLSGPHQVSNAAVALACLEVLGDQGLPLSAPQLRAGLAATRWPGRLEVVGDAPPVVLDGAHNPDGVRALTRSLDALYPGRRVHLVFGVLADKSWNPMIAELFPRCASVALAPVASGRSLDPAQYLTAARQLAPVVTAHASAPEALAAARARASAGDLVLVAGSLVLIGELRSTLVR